ncbi:gamma-glutamylcyclotransferase family protein, partial [Okeania sp. SIO2B9]|uniref:gamma-glutamylcyclotransferase family protein n=1 Tax=Okeania sp. SIO2B9 TaxID=2607782 RepID=UPI001429BC3C
VPTNNVDPSYANLVYQKNSIVHGCLYEMSPECKAVIDGLEGKVKYIKKKLYKFCLMVQILLLML